MDKKEQSRVKEMWQNSKQSMQKIMDNKYLQRLRFFQTLLIKLAFWGITVIFISLGHFYIALTIILAASFFFKELLAVSRNLRKDDKIQMEWLELYWYFVSVYLCIPIVFFSPNN